jgi:hypothetical protein
MCKKLDQNWGCVEGIDIIFSNCKKKLIARKDESKKVVLGLDIQR